MKTLLRHLASPFGSRLAVLLYHRVFRPVADPQLLCVTPERFENQMRALREAFPVLSLEELRAGLASGRLPKRAALVTFDDGYADNLENALPVLESIGLPSAFFVTTGAIGREEEFWWDALERLVLRAPGLADPLRLGGRAWPTGTAESRRKAYEEIHALLRPLPPADREEGLRALHTMARGDPGPRPDYRALSPEGLKSLAQGRGVEIGSHTVSHAVLSCQTPERRLAELSRSREVLEALLGRPVRALAYPFGGEADVNASSKAEASACGYDLAFTTRQAPLCPSDPPFDLPRFLVRDWEVGEFRKRLDAFFGS